MSLLHEHHHRVEVGGRHVVTHGLPRSFWQNLYHNSMTMSWGVFFAAVGFVFLLLNLIFGFLYWLGDKPIANLVPDGFWGCFFFSVETIATVGYGDMHPQSLYAHIVSSIEIFTGMMSIALITGVMFARFSRPRAMILFARHPVLSPVGGVPTLVIRTANARLNVIIDASAKLRLIRNEVSAEGQPFRRIYDLNLLRTQHPIFVLGWSILHPVDETSPLLGETAASLEATGAGLILTIDGVDETTGQNVQSRHYYDCSRILWGHRYVDTLTVDADGIGHMDYAKFHATEPFGPRGPEPG